MPSDDALPMLKAPPRPLSERLLGAAALVTGLALGIPVLTIIVLALMPTENVWPHLIATVLPGYVMRTLGLMAGVGIITFAVGTAVAWLVTMCRFPLRPLFVWASLLPLAMPGYIVAYAYVDFLSYAGPLQTWLRGVFGWTRPADYWFPEIRSLGGAIFVLSMVLYPYVFLTARASFIRQPATHLEVARALGRTPWGAFRNVALPMARPGIAVGVSLALMECLNDIGAAGFFGVHTLTLGVYTTWLSQGNLGGAAQISAVMLIFIFVLVWIERTARRRQSFVLPSQRPRQPDRIRLNGWQRVLAVVVCALPILIGFVVPALVLMGFAVSRLDQALSVTYLKAVYHSLLLAQLRRRWRWRWGWCWAMPTARCARASPATSSASPAWVMRFRARCWASASSSRSRHSTMRSTASCGRTSASRPGFCSQARSPRSSSPMWCASWPSPSAPSRPDFRR